MNTKNIGRNDPCPCGSGKKYKQCCQNTVPSSHSVAIKTRQLESIPILFKQATLAINHNNTKLAEDIYQEILSINAKHVDTLNNLAFLFVKTNRHKLAAETLRKLIQIEPTAKNYYNLSNLIRDDEGFEYIRKSLRLNPGSAEAFNLLGIYLLDKNLTQEAIIAFKKSISLNANTDQAFNNLANIMLLRGNYEEASLYYQTAIKNSPTTLTHYQNYLFCLSFDTNLSANKYLDTARTFEKLVSQNVLPYTQWDTPSGFSSEKPLNIGFVSGDLRTHVVSFFIENILKELKENPTIRLFAYNTTNFENDPTTKRLQTYFTQWHNISSIDSKLAAKHIHDDNIHILIDLSGYSLHTGLSIFAWRPAPIQVSWLGYWSSTGLSCINYFIADPIGIPTENQHQFSEKIWYLPQTRLCFTPPTADIAPPANALPLLTNGFVTFGCFQSTKKINDNTLRLWAKILNSCPNSKLKLKSLHLEEPIVRDEMLARLASCGITAHQVTIEGASERAKYFHSYHDVDLMLDTFPYPGGTTTCEALWMGVPTLTLTGNTLLERQGHSLLSNAGLIDWVCSTQEEYLQKAIDFSRNLTYLGELRETLRAQVAQSPLMNAPQFTKHLIEAFGGMWDSYQKTLTK